MPGTDVRHQKQGVSFISASQLWKEMVIVFVSQYEKVEGSAHFYWFECFFPKNLTCTVWGIIRSSKNYIKHMKMKNENKNTHEKKYIGDSACTKIAYWDFYGPVL